MCSPTHNAAATMTDYPPVDPPLRGPVTQAHQAAFSKRLPACSAAARAMDSPGLAPSNQGQGKDQTRSMYSATYSRMYVLFSFLLPSLPTVGGDALRDLTFFFSFRTQLLRPEVERHLPVWTWLGAACGAGLGFITANMPGLVVGAYAGNRLGAIRDAKGKSVAAVFAELGAAQKAEVSRKTPMSYSPYLHLDYDLLTDLARARFEGARCCLHLSSDDCDTMHGPIYSRRLRVR
jgi:hypothetical protein